MARDAANAKIAFIGPTPDIQIVVSLSNAMWLVVISLSVGSGHSIVISVVTGKVTGSEVGHKLAYSSR